MNLLNEDNVVHIFLSRIGDLVVANLLFIVCCIPIVTIGRHSQHYTTVPCAW
ncbi:MAG: hypothetical protein ACLRMZ_17995 [Blautia marasmi]